jgi:hypothetical protein
VSFTVHNGASNLDDDASVHPGAPPRPSSARIIPRVVETSWMRHQVTLAIVHAVEPCITGRLE